MLKCLFIVCILSTSYAMLAVENGEKSWPKVKNFDIWNTIIDQKNVEDVDSIQSKKDVDVKFKDFLRKRKAKVFHLFPVPVDGECLSNDGRRTGTCLNIYECRLKGGIAQGECSMGFGVCCIFLASCDQTISNNITYLVSPNFPSTMAKNFTVCKYKLKMMDSNISQLRIDFNHFSLGQPNRKTGICDGDVFNVTGGPSGNISLCGQNSGQHLYYDVDSRKIGREFSRNRIQQSLLKSNGTMENKSLTDDGLIEITMSFSNRFSPIRFWEIRIAQIPFSQRAPANCLQYFTGLEGVVQTFNFADNGRHLANQNYRSCIRQEANMCSIMYQPCDDQSFKIGPTRLAVQEQNNISAGEPQLVQTLQGNLMILNSTTFQGQTVQANPMKQNSTNVQDQTVQANLITQNSTTFQDPTNQASLMTQNSTTLPDQTVQANPMTQNSTALQDQLPTTSSNAPTAQTESTTSNSVLADDEGSGEDNFQLPDGTPQRPVRGGFDILSLFRSAFSYRSFARSSKQLFTTCNDRITMPCIIEDFVGFGMGALPGCEPIHCGNQFCASGVEPCRIESTVTPFYLGVHFGNGMGKGSAEENIGACIRFTQMQCI